MSTIEMTAWNILAGTLTSLVLRRVVTAPRRESVYYQSQPLEIWHGGLCLAYGLWIWLIPYSAYDAEVYRALLRYIPAGGFSILFCSIALLTFFGIWQQLLWLRRVVAWTTCMLWFGAAAYYFFGDLHLLGFPPCLIFGIQQGWVAATIKKEEWAD